jgi:NAD+ kinase
MTLGLVHETESLSVKSRMRQARLFLDGDHIAHDVTIGDVLTMRRASEPLVILGLNRAF